MFPTDPIRTAQHNRLMTELKSLYLRAEINADIKKILRDRLHRYARILQGRSGTPDIQEAIPNYFSNQKIAIYTAIFGPVDDIHEPLFVPDNCDFFIFTDQTIHPDSSWKVMPLDEIPLDIALDQVLANRYVKMFPDRFFPDYTYTIYLDGKYQARTDLTEFIQDMPSQGLRMFFHPLRNCVYDEIETCIRLGKDSAETLRAHATYLQSTGMPVKYGMLEGGLIVRQTGNPLCQAIMLEWWQEFLQHSKRDQVSLPYVLWRHQISIESLAIPKLCIWTYPAIKKWPHVKNSKPASNNGGSLSGKAKQ